MAGNERRKDEEEDDREERPIGEDRPGRRGWWRITRAGREDEGG